jgi:3-hydroxyisobutyrate dehydrogenase-like beta-hydroxyacid dehydrogenase
VLQGADGVLAGARQGSVLAIASTVKPQAMPAIVALADAAAKGIAVLDTPVCRGEPAAEAGRLLLLAGGDQAAFERCRPAFSSFADALYRLGGSGAGQVGKMVNNMILWACVCGNYEGMKLAATLGADVDLLVEALTKSSANNYALETWHDPRPMPWAEKDMAIVLEEAEMARLPLPLSGVIREVVKQIKNEKGAPVPVARK